MVRFRAMSTRRAGLLLGILSHLGPACSESGPIDAFLRFVEAVSERNAGGVWEGLSRADRARLEAASERLRSISDGAVSRPPRELLFAAALHFRGGKRAVTVVRQSADEAVLRVRTEPGGEAEVTLVREEGAWRVVLSPRPAAAPARGAGAPG